jgi:hypothetical protein
VNNEGKNKGGKEKEKEERNIRISGEGARRCLKVTKC